MLLKHSEVQGMGKSTNGTSLGNESWQNDSLLKGQQCLSLPHQLSRLPRDSLGDSVSQLIHVAESAGDFKSH